MGFKTYPQLAGSIQWGLYQESNTLLHLWEDGPTQWGSGLTEGISGSVLFPSTHFDCTHHNQQAYAASHEDNGLHIQQTRGTDSTPASVTLTAEAISPNLQQKRTSLVTVKSDVLLLFGGRVHCWDIIQSGQHLYLIIQSHSETTQNNAVVTWSLLLSPRSLFPAQGHASSPLLLFY